MKTRFFRLQTLRWLLASVGFIGATIGPKAATAQLVQQWSRFYGTPALTETIATTLRLGPNRFISAGAWALQNRIPDPEDYQSYFLVTDTTGAIVQEILVNDSTRQSLGLLHIVTASLGEGYGIGIGYDSAQQYRYQVCRFDSLGQMRWHRWLPGKLSSVENKRLLALPNGVLAPDSKFGRGGRAAVTRLDGAGHLRWQRTSSRQSDGPEVVPLPDGSYAWLTTDIWRQTGPVNIYYGYDFKLLKLSPAGDSLGCVYLNDTGYDIGDRLIATTDGGLLLIGRNSIPPFAIPQRAVVIKLDANWQEQWRYTLVVPNGNNDDGARLFDAEELANGHYLLLTSAPNKILEIAPPTSGSSTASLVWSLPLPTQGGETVAATHLVLDNDPAGTLRLFGGWVTYSPRFNVDTWRGLYTGVSAPAATVNYCALPPSTPAASFQFLPPLADSLRFSLDVAATTPGPRYAEISRIDWDWGDGTPADSGRAVTHRFASRTPVRVRCTVTNNLFCATSLDLFPFGPLTALAEERARAAALAVFPNPSADGRFTLRLPDADADDAPPGAHLTICDALGRVLSQLPAESPQTRLDLSQQPPGVYWLRLTWPDGSTVSKKLVRW